jgi:hypothetical protein
MAKPYMKIIDVSLDETHYVPMLDMPHETDRICRCQPEVCVGALGFSVEHRPWSATTPEDQ